MTDETVKQLQLNPEIPEDLDHCLEKLHKVYLFSICFFFTITFDLCPARPLVSKWRKLRFKDIR